MTQVFDSSGKLKRQSVTTLPLFLGKLLIKKFPAQASPGKYAHVVA